MTLFANRTTCRSCGSTNLRKVIDFGLQPLAGYYARSAREALTASRYPLILYSCGRCDLLQITDLPPIDEVFHDDYAYSSSQIGPLVEHFREYSAWLAERLPADASILEFGCNDGILLDQLRRRGLNRLTGVDASANMAKSAAARGFDVVHGFFGGDIAEKLAGRPSFDVITCSNVLAHVDDLQETMKASWDLLSNRGELCVEVHDAERLIIEGQFETIYHEHLTYFSESSLETCLAIAGFELLEIEKTTMHGGGLRARSRKVSSGKVPIVCNARTDSEVEAIGKTLEERVASCRTTILNLNSEFGMLDGYGMAGRAQMFLSMTETQSVFGRLFDDAPIRQGRYAVCTDLRISAFDPAEVSEVCIILAWNYATAIVPKLLDYYRQVHVLFPEIARLA